MTRKSAIAHLAHKVTGCKATGESKADGVNVVALEMATNALKKQEPQRVIESDDEYTCYCPSCEYPVLDCDYCKHCGQRLDWFDEEK